ncbi:bifunctional P-type ATPase [Babesia duncani]|uniref:Bifunctional P-type ATPase n=1 Tax=Babesia duncani TaxID=323732 RepID=A0AAD9UNB0_9APIC|nr:bifunctional P-type ATPase [Babesia duncani]
MTDKKKSVNLPPTPRDGGSSGNRSNPPSSRSVDQRTTPPTISINGQGEGNATNNAFSRILPPSGVPMFADALEMEVVNKLSKSQLLAEDVIEFVKHRNVSQFHEAKKSVEQIQPSTGKSHFAHSSIETIMDEFGLNDVTQGLSSAQVDLNLQLYGKNILVAGESEPIWKIYLSQFYNFVVILLLTAAVATLALGNVVEGVFIILIVNINAVMATYMEKSAANALEKLAELSSPTCTVIRDGIVMTLDTKKVVPGDVILLKMGDSVAADIRLFDIMEIRLNESLLTGESLPVKKTLKAIDMDSPFSSNLCFASTSVIAGSAKGIVVNTGMNTQVGKIAAQLKKAAEGGKMTPLQHGINRLGGTIGMISAMVLVTIVIVASLTGYEDPTHPDASRILSIVLLAVGFAVSSVPEGLPMVVTIALSLGARDMARKNANIRKLPAVETLGCCSIICSDKTGTLTEGKMTATTIVNFRKENHTLKGKELRFFPTLGFNPIGGVFNPSDLTNDYTRQIMDQVNNEGNMNNVDKNIIGQSDNMDAAHVKLTLLTAYLNSYATKLERNEKSNIWKAVGNMTEGPLIVAAAKCGIGKTLNPHDTTEIDYPMIEQLEVPFNSSRKMMCTVHKLKVPNTYGDLDMTSSSGETYTHVATIKGAPDMLFNLCKGCISTNGNRCCIDWTRGSSGLTREEINELVKTNDVLSMRALRVLLFGIFPLTDEDINELRKCDDSDLRLKYLLGEGDSYKAPLVLLGFVGSLDPPRHGVRDAIKTCGEAGIRVIMITGDQQATANAVAKEIGLFEQPDAADSKVIECRYLHINNDNSQMHLPDAKIDEYTCTVSVFCRAQPEDKVAIIESLRRQKHLTAMTGDGVNDAPALKTADIGISMGINGTDVAKGASEMVLLDDDFCTIVKAVESGRTIYANIQKFVSFLLGTNIGEILYLTISIGISTLPPVDALQILFLNFMTDGCPAVALSKEPADSDVMSKKPRPPNQPVMTRDWWIYGNIPHTIFEAASVIASILLALYLCTGVIYLSDLKQQCKFVDLKDADGNVSTYPYFCRSFEYRVTTNYTGWVTNINYYDPQKQKMITALGAFYGKVDNPTPQTQGLLPEVAKAFADMEGVAISPELEKDENGWYKSKTSQVVGKDTEKSKLVGVSPRGYYEINSRKAMQARTISFITAVWCEMLRAYTVRSWDYFFQSGGSTLWLFQLH